MAKFIGQTGLIYLWTKIKALVATKHDVIDSTHKLSADLLEDGVTNVVYTATEKTKLSGIESGAEANQNAFGNVKIGSTTIVADAATDTLELVAGDNITFTADATNDKITITATDTTYTPATATPEMDGTAAVGSSEKYAREDHVHPTDTSRAAASHTHGNITNTGKLQTTDVTIGLGDKLVITDASDTDAVARASLAFDGSTATKALTQKGTFESFVSPTSIGAASGICPLDSSAKIDAQYLPSYVDDVIEAYIRSNQTALSSTWLATESASGTVITPEKGKIYVLMNSNNDYPENTQFRWGGSSYVKLNDGGISELTTQEMDTATSNWT